MRYSPKYACSSEAITFYRFAKAGLGDFHAVLSLHPLTLSMLNIMRPRVRRIHTIHVCGGDVEEMTPLFRSHQYIYAVLNNSVMQDVLRGWISWLRLERTLRTTRTRHCSLDINSCLSYVRHYVIHRMYVSVGRKVSTEAEFDIYYLGV